MVPWSGNIQDAPPRPMNLNDFDVKERAFPFHNTDSDAFIRVDADSVTFRLQKGPIREVGVNGCQIDDMVKFIIDTVAGFNAKFSCRENQLAIEKLTEAWLWFAARKLDREARSVEGLNKK